MAHDSVKAWSIVDREGVCFGIAEGDTIEDARDHALLTIASGHHARLEKVHSVLMFFIYAWSFIVAVATLGFKRIKCHKTRWTTFHAGRYFRIEPREHEKTNKP